MSSDGSSVVTPGGWQPDAPQTLAAENLLYPELAGHGQLATAVQAAAAALAVDVGVVMPSDSDPRRAALVESAVPDRRPMDIGIGAVERWFLVNGWSRGVELVSGATTDLTEVVRAASAWRHGASLNEIEAAASFIKVSNLARAHERGPADAVAEKWRLLRAAYSSEDRFRFLADILEAAYAVTALSQLFPYTSHATLCFSTCTGYPYSSEIAHIEPRDGGGYFVRDHLTGDLIGEADDAQSAVALLVAHLPASVGPARAGTAVRV